MTNEQLWQAALGELELTISKANFTTWFKNTFISSNSNGTVLIGVPNSFTKAWLESKYHSFILKALKNISENQIKEVIYRVETKKSLPKQSATVLKEERLQTVPDIKEIPQLVNGFGLNPRYTLETFVVGKGNELAQAAARAVADKPGLVYNPLFIYGGAGLGKTHLMQAIGHRVLEKFPKKKVVYATCEKFTNEFIQSVSSGKISNFKGFYRNVDVLMIDDIQFLAGKEGTQEEFFHTFNALHQANKQIVISSDRPPKSIPALEHRLISRFEWGMIADIAQPDLETRIAILEQKCKEKNYNLSAEIVNYIASNIQSNVRELEGALNRIIAFQELNNIVPSLESVKSLLSNATSRPRKSGLTPKQIINTVANFYDISIENLLGDSRKKELVVPRQIAMYLMREELKSSYPNIGNELGGRDHTTAMHACAKITEEVQSDEKIKQDITLIQQRLYSQ